MHVLVSSLESSNATTANAGKIPDWAGADREALLFDTFENFVPVDVVRLPGIIFNAVIRPDIVHRIVVWQTACRRRGIHNTKVCYPYGKLSIIL